MVGHFGPKKYQNPSEFREPLSAEIFIFLSSVFSNLKSIKIGPQKKLAFKEPEKFLIHIFCIFLIQNIPLFGADIGCLARCQEKRQGRPPNSAAHPAHLCSLKIPKSIGGFCIQFPYLSISRKKFQSKNCK